MMNKIGGYTIRVPYVRMNPSYTDRENSVSRLNWIENHNILY